MKKKSLFFLFLPIVLGSIVGFLISNFIDYDILNLPVLAPPKLAFPIMWSIIYILMGISYYIYKKENPEFLVEDLLYYIQLFVNLFWSIIFFIWKLRFIAIIWIILLDILVILLIYNFYKRKAICAYLNIPYLLWIIFATYLTIGIYVLN